jgi:hypothetical protein
MKKIIGRIILGLVLISTLIAGYVAGRTYKNYEIKHADMLDHSKMSNMHTDMHMNKKISTLPGWAEARVDIVATDDSMGGYNLKINTTAFRFTPEAAGKAVVPNSGHAHLLVNDKKIGRIYGNYFYLPANLFVNGTNTIEVSLNANDHSTWMSRDGKRALSATTTVFVK